MYHQVCSTVQECEISPALRVDVESFENQMRAIKEIGVPIGLDEMIGRIKTRRRPDKLYFSVTFDDGYRDNYLYAYPILKTESVPATIYVTTGFLDNRNSMIPWWDRVRRLAEKLGELPSGEREYFLDRMGLSNQDSVQTLYRALGGYQKKIVCGIIQDDEFVERLSRATSDMVDNQALKWDDLAEMVGSGLITIGAHTVTHPSLAFCPDSGFVEIKNSIDRIESMIRTRVLSFAYPFGKSCDYNQDTIRHLKTLGVESALTIRNGINHSNSDLFRIRRIPVIGMEKLNRFITRIKCANTLGFRK